MDLTIYQKENEWRKNAKEITDEKLILWEPTKYTQININENDPHILIKSDRKFFIERKEFNKRFHTLSGGMLSYIDWKNVIVAGGCISNTLNRTCTKKNISDIDLFIYGLDEENAKIKITELVNSVENYCKDMFNTDLHILKNKFVISLIPHTITKRQHKVQIIIRLYKNIYEVLAGFDVDASAIAYNGRDIYLTKRSLNAFQTKYNVVDLSRRSPSYESRLYKYNKRGFGIYIPFKYRNKNNKLYFMNRKALGIDKLMYLIKYAKARNFNRFFNIVTQRINKRIKYRNSASYENNDEFVFEKNDIRNSIMQFNKHVEEKFKYKLYNKYSKITKNLNFIKQNPGQQLTGSFNPITKDDWIDVDYSVKNVDFLGRNLELLKIKNNASIDFTTIHKMEIYDNSLLNPFCYMLMYTNNEESLISTWGRKKLFPTNKNLYNISYLELALLMNRYNLFRYVLERHKENNKSEDVDYNKLIQLCFVLDNVKGLQLISEFNKINIHDYNQTIKKYSCLNIANHFCLKINNYQKKTTLEQIKEMEPSKRPIFLHNFWYKWGYYYNQVNLKKAYQILDYYKLDINIIRMLNHLERNNKTDLRALCFKDLKLKVNIKEQPYNENTFEHFWYNKMYELTLQEQKEKEIKRDEFATRLLKELYSLREEKINKKREITFIDPIKVINPFILNIMKHIYHDSLDQIKDIRILYKGDKNDYKPIAHLLLIKDDINTTMRVVGKNHIEEFLKKHKLNKNLQNYLTKLESEKMNLEKENIFVKYSEIFENTKYHINVYNDGILNKKYDRKENIFGYTPCDYVINKLLYFYNTITNKKCDLDKKKLKLLTNLRASICNIDRTKEIVPINKKHCINMELERVLEMID